MAECVRCGDFTDNPAEKEYHYCDSCLDRFDEIREGGVVIQQSKPHGDYNVFVTHGGDKHRGGTEESQKDALARAKHLADELNTDALFQYEATGSQWVLEQYLQEHPSVRRDVLDRLRRVPDDRDAGLIARVKGFFN